MKPGDQLHQSAPTVMAALRDLGGDEAFDESTRRILDESMALSVPHLAESLVWQRPSIFRRFVGWSTSLLQHRGGGCTGHRPHHPLEWRGDR